MFRKASFRFELTIKELLRAPLTNAEIFVKVKPPTGKDEYAPPTPVQREMVLLFFRSITK